MVGWHHSLDGRESEQTPGAGEGQGSPACCSPGGKEADTTYNNSVAAIFPLGLEILDSLGRSKEG